MMYNSLKGCTDDLGSNFRGHVMVLECNLRKTGAGKPFIAMKVTDGNISVDCVRWSNSTEYAPGLVILLTGESNDYNGEPQLKIKGAQFAPEVDKSQFVVAVDDTGYINCMNLIKREIENEDLKDILLQYYEVHCDELIPAAGAVKYHHNYAGGLMDHIYEVTNYALAIYDSSKPEVWKHINKDVLIASSVMHDLGKLYQYKVDELTGIVTPDMAYFYTDHIIDTCVDLRRLLGGFNFYLQIEHCIISHHGRLEWGALKEPASLEAYILHEADMLSSQLESMRLAFEKPANEFGWTKGKVFPFGCHIFVGNRGEE